jgi:hypothetical protein
MNDDKENKPSQKEHLKSIWHNTLLDLTTSPTARAAFMANDTILSILILRGIITYHLAEKTYHEYRTPKHDEGNEDPPLLPDPIQTL